MKETSDIPLCALLKNFKPLDIISNCSSFTKLQRVIAWCKRFIKNARYPLSRTMGPLKSKELSESLQCIIKNIQRTLFSNEIQYLEKGIPLPNSYKLLILHLATGRTKHTRYREGPGNDRGEGSEPGEERKAVAKKTWSKKDTDGRCIVIL
ncbi:integrase_H2C2 domain-containing protein [Trichonephila clavipes]|uniref:Integrase_H2C2 domain-containing protein n=1 Tax=Trichonephila clavipes TaxID=2585209 RepID=A0A8X6RQM6_TRICX|nr:integrase_H2C2 domain-containing protein [Trichonephila clavipes]